MKRDENHRARKIKNDLRIRIDRNRWLTGAQAGERLYISRRLPTEAAREI